MKECDGMDELPAEDLCDACLSRPGTLRFPCTVTRDEAVETVRQWSASRRVAPHLEVPGLDGGVVPPPLSPVLDAQRPFHRVREGLQG
ncbi:hypothetical protein E2N92_00600 [Methanofollis formosanus]|uniref:Uncharacterized protein n=1 Tax=Methanofollis formosanus TaxID=299308 RepID=A0A8G1A043_9EURY|nr:hypothetical protein [Methanofollis formosanus]QYZ78033.1 hypothetical protein E2N92_00600 [Methanofollis formosanus]